MRLSTKLIYPTLFFSNFLIAGSQAFVAHEWGTFTSLVGSDGKTQHGMYHEDEILPGFVHGFGEVAKSEPEPVVPRRPCRGKGCFLDDYFANNIVSQKMETPVVYFYSNKQEKVSFTVKFPKGIITETFPAPVKSYPAKSSSPELKNGEVTFALDILPQLNGNLPSVDPQNIYAHARHVKSNVVRSHGEEEKFVFYRGLGQFQPSFQLVSSNGSLFMRRGLKPRAAFLVHVNEQGESRTINLEAALKANSDLLATAGQIATLENHRSTQNDLGILDAAQSKAAMIQALIKEGLNDDEARSMLNTWEHGYLKVPGLRLLYIVPKAEVDRNLPIQFDPAPEALERVFVGRLEILTDLAEEKLIARIEAELEGLNVNSLGRFAEAMLRRSLQVYQGKSNPDLKVLEAINKLIIRAAQSDTKAQSNVQ